MLILTSIIIAFLALAFTGYVYLVFSAIKKLERKDDL